MTLHVVRRIQFVNSFGVFRPERQHLNIRIGFLAQFPAFRVILKVLARADIAHDSLDGTGTLVKARQLLGDIVMSEINVQRSRPVYENILLPEKTQQVQPIVRAEDTDALICQTVRLKCDRGYD